MSEPQRQASVTAEAALMRRFGPKIGLKLVVIAVADFILLWIWAPNLVDRHQDLALVGAIVCLGAALALTVWLGFRLWLDLKQFADARRQMRRGAVLKVVQK